MSWTKTAAEAVTRAAGIIARGDTATAATASAVPVAKRRRPMTRPADSPWNSTMKPSTATGMKAAAPRVRRKAQGLPLPRIP